jgi:hypothetical protein
LISDPRLFFEESGDGSNPDIGRRMGFFEAVCDCDWSEAWSDTLKVIA